MSEMKTYKEVAKLVGTGAVGSAYQGYSVKLSEDGNYLFIAGVYDNNGIGAVWFYQKINGVWTQKQKIVPTGSSGSSPNFGVSIAVNPSMSTLIVGAYGDSSAVGASFVFTFDSTTWTQQAKLVGNGGTGSYGSGQGWSVALSADGNTAIVGGYWDGNYVGAAWIFVQDGSTWAQQGSKLVATDASGEARQGQSVALTSDGLLAVVGGHYDQSQIGAIWCFLRSGTSWNQVGPKITATGESGNGQFGWSLALSGDDQTLVVGAYADNSYAGAAWIFKRDGDTFTQFGSKLVGVGATSSARQGYKVAVNKHGTLVAVGATFDSSKTGAVFVHYFNGTQYKQLGNKIVGSGVIGQAQQGFSVSLDGLGTQLLFGGFGDNGNAGAAWIYVNTTITASPSATPTVVPTTQPSVGPTTQPSVGPTTLPSLEPTTQPSVGPTTQPSVVPTTQPSVGPTAQPSVGPTTQPSVGPTTQPSVGPTTEPSLEPSLEPSVEPSLEPSWAPTFVPTTAMPSVEPTFLPSFLPTVAPSAAPIQASNAANDKLSSGGIAGIVIGVLVAVVVLAGIAWNFSKPVTKSGKEGAPFVPDELESGKAL